MSFPDSSRVCIVKVDSGSADMVKGLQGFRMASCPGSVSSPSQSVKAKGTLSGSGGNGGSGDWNESHACLPTCRLMLSFKTKGC